MRRLRWPVPQNVSRSGHCSRGKHWQFPWLHRHWRIDHDFGPFVRWIPTDLPQFHIRSSLPSDASRSTGNVCNSSWNHGFHQHPGVARRFPQLVLFPQFRHYRRSTVDWIFLRSLHRQDVVDVAQFAIAQNDSYRQRRNFGEQRIVFRWKYQVQIIDIFTYFTILNFK